MTRSQVASSTLAFVQLDDVGQSFAHGIAPESVSQAQVQEMKSEQADA